MTQKPQYQISDVNAMDSDTFMAVFGAIFEDSPWAAKQAWERLPFSSVESLTDVMCQSVIDAGPEAQLVLICAHPELGTNRKMAKASAREQTAAGIRERSDETKELLGQLNERYREKFGFPFIIAVKGLTMDLILENIQNRLSNDRESEFNECLQQVFRIARFRLDELLI